MSERPHAAPITAGPAVRVTCLALQPAESYEGVYVQLDSGVVHVFSADQRAHILTMPMAAALIEWQDAAVLQPQPRMPAISDAAYEQIGEQMQQVQQMFQQMGFAPDED
jgi:hypothetical protein